MDAQLAIWLKRGGLENAIKAIEGEKPLFIIYRDRIILL
jgi:hypothetical protein